MFIHMWIIFIFNQFFNKSLRVFHIDLQKLFVHLWYQSFATFIASSPSLTFTSVYYLFWPTEFLNYCAVKSTFSLYIFFHCLRGFSGLESVNIYLNSSCILSISFFSFIFTFYTKLGIILVYGITNGKLHYFQNMQIILDNFFFCLVYKTLPFTSN